MELHQIRYFLALCAELNFTRAAERCDVAQSSLTRAIKLLESELGGALFHRGASTHLTHLTGLGERVKPFLTRAYGEVRDASRAAQDFARARSASLRLGLMRTLAPSRLAALLAALRARAPDLDLQVSEAGALALQERLLAGELDAAIYSLGPGDDTLDHLPLYREPFVVVVQAGHRLARRGAVRLSDLQGEPYLARAHCEHAAVIEEAFSWSGVDARPVFGSDRDEWILALAAAGLGYALMPAESAAHPGTVALALADGIAREIALVTLRGGRESPAVGALTHEAIRLRHRAAAAPPHDSASLSDAVLA